MNEVVKYHNVLNKVEFKGFTPVETDLFFSICTQIKEKGTEEVVFSFDQIKEISSFKPTANSRFFNTLKKTNEKLQKLSIEFDDGVVFKSLVLFPTFEINRDSSTLRIKVNSEFEFILNALDSNFTRFELQEFLRIKSIFSKTMYRLLKQWRTVGQRKFAIEEFKGLLNIPGSYRMSDIDKQVLSPITKELSPYFKNLKITKIKKGRGRGGKVVEILFEFTPQGHRAEAKARLKEEFGENYEENLPKVTMHNWLNAN